MAHTFFIPNRSVSGQRRIWKYDMTLKKFYAAPQTKFLELGEDADLLQGSNLGTISTDTYRTGYGTLDEDTELNWE